MTLLIKHPSYRNLSNTEPFDIFKHFFKSNDSLSYYNNQWTGSIPTDIDESEDSYRLTLELPGVDKKDIDVSYKDEILSISATKNAPHSDDSVREEIQRGRIERSFRVKGINFEDAQAEYKNGLLTLTLPKAAEHKAQTLSIS